MLNQSFRQVFVSNIPALLPAGKTVDSIAVGQVGIIDERTKTAVTAPTYGTNKALKIVWGTPDLPESLLAINQLGGPNQNEYSKLIKGKLLRNFRGHAASRGQHQVVTVGFSGDVADTDTLFAKPGELKELFLTLTGDVITKEYSIQGIQRRYYFKDEILNDCEDTCVDVSPRKIAEFLAAQINFDKTINRYVKASVVLDPVPSTSGAITLYKFQLNVPDTQDNIALGNVQAQYPDYDVKRIGTSDLYSTYEATRTVNTAPTGFSQSGTLIPDCPTCPAGFSTYQSGYVYRGVVADAGSDISSTIVTKINAASTGAGTQVSKVSNTNYIIVTQNDLTPAAITTAITASSGPAVTSITFVQHSNRFVCVQTTPTVTAWGSAGTVTKLPKKYRLSLADDICGNDRLADVQHAYPSSVVTLVDAGGECIHTYEITVYSQELQAGCSLDTAQWSKPTGFEGAQWREVAPAADATQYKAGIRLDVAVVNKTTNEATFQYFPYEADAVYLEVSTGDQDYNSPVPLENFWVVKQVQGVKFPQGVGQYIQKLEKDSLAYNLKFRDDNPVLRELTQYEFQAKTGKFYDEYVLEFDFQYFVGGWSEKYTDSYSLFIYFPEGQGKAFETAINTYIQSAQISIDPVIL